MRIGPFDPSRTVPAARLLPAARSAGAAAGVTRLAEITRLDRLGLPVWQAIRPISRALSVHQGKGASDEDAQVGALLEGVESDAAERFDEIGPVCRFEDLPVRGRAPTLDDFARDRRRPPDPGSRIRWVEARDLAAGQDRFLPFDLVSLDLTRAVPSPFARTSNGLATGATRDEAIVAALHELIERDALAEWAQADALERMEAAVDRAGIAFDWFGLWRDRLRAADIDVAVHHVPTVTGSPMFVCTLSDFGKDGAAFGANRGFGCHAIPEIALFRALAEALQARATVIAGARDDLRPSDYVRPAGVAVDAGLAPPLPPGRTGKAFGSIAAGPAGVAAMAEALAGAGYGQGAIVDLGRPAGLSVVRAFVCGLGAGRRRRRRPD